MTRTIQITLLAMIALGLSAVAEGQGKRKSPHETVSATIGGADITIEYGRPYKKGRKVFGGLEAYGKVWRTGADEATKLTTSGDLMVGGIHVPKGSYSLFTIPGEKEWTLILNKTSEQWGAFDYKQADDLGRTPMTVKTLGAPLEQHTIEIKSTGGSNGVLTVSWDQTSASVDVMAH